MADVPFRRPGSARSVWLVRAGLAGLLVLIFVVVVLRSNVFGLRGSPAQVPPGHTKVPVAGAAIHALQKIEMGHLKFGIVPDEKVNKDWILEPADIVGRTALVEISEKRPFKDALLGPKAGGSGSSGAIQKGWVAVTLDMDKVEGPVGLLPPGTAVAVLATSEGTSRSAQVSVVSKRALVLSSGTKMELDQKARAVMKAGRSHSEEGTVITLQIPAEDAVRLVQAQKMGRIHLFILSSAEGEEVRLSPFPALESHEPVEIIRGTRRSVEFSGTDPNRPERQEEK